MFALIFISKFKFYRIPYIQSCNIFDSFIKNENKIKLISSKDKLTSAIFKWLLTKNYNEKMFRAFYLNISTILDGITKINLKKCKI